MEEWRSVVGYEGLYEVSNLGRVKTVKTGRIKKFTSHCLDTRPFLQIWKNNTPKIFRPHTLVLTAFIGPRPDGMECCHNDGNPWHNMLSNLRWDTAASNQKDRIKHGTTNRGENCGTAKLTQFQVDAIRKDSRLQRVIAYEYGVLQSAISRIKSGKRWAHS